MEPIIIPRKRYLLHAFLFLATCATTYLAGGPVFAGTLMAILVTHEMGHYVAARRHGINVSLPYFIPVPFVGIGTLGAVIRMNAPIQRRTALIDVGAAGPLAGLAVAIPLLVGGLVASPVTPLVISPDQPAFIEGNSLLYLALKYLTKGRYLPAGGVDVQLGPMAMAAWVGLLITFINLIPVGQLDGGHVATAYFGSRWERVAAWVHAALLAAGLVVFMHLLREAVAAGKNRPDALAYAAAGGAPWLIWALLLVLMRRFSGGRYHPPVGADPLPRSRRILFWVVAVALLLLITPVPMREAL